MKRPLAIVLVGVLLCTVCAWLFARRDARKPASEPSRTLQAAQPGSAEVAAVPEASAPDELPQAVRSDLTTLVPVALSFKGPAATLSLEIVGALGKLPIPDVAVSVLEFPPGGSESEITTWDYVTEAGDPPLTDGSGRLALRVPADRLLAVAVSGIALRTEPHSQQVPALAEGENRTVTLELAAEGDLRVFGIAVDGATQAPIAGVEIQLERRPSIEPIAVSDAEGRFELRSNSWESRKASASKRGFLPVVFQVDDQHDRASRAQRLVLLRAATVQGFYRDCDERPVAEGSLRFWTSSGFRAHVYPREDGWFEADSLPTGETVKVDLELEHRPIAREVASLVLEPGELRRVDWKLPPRYRLHGIVLDERDVPVQGGELALYFGNAADLQCLGLSSPLDERDNCTSDAQGRFEFTKAGEGSWVVALMHAGGRSGFLRPPYSWHIALAAENITVPGAESAELVLHCWRFLTLQGRIVDAEDHPVPRAELSVGLVGCDASVQRWTGADGLFNVPLPAPGSYEISVKSSTWFLESGKVSARAGERDIVIRLKRAPALHLRVIDGAKREPLEAQVFGIGTSGASVHLVVYAGQDGRGQLAAPCPTDTYRLFVRTFGGRCGTLDGVIVDAESPAREWTVAVAPGKHAAVHSSNAGGIVETEFTWNGIPIDAEDLEQGSKIVLSVPPGTLSARYRRVEPPGDWLTLDTTIDDARLVDIDLRFP